MNSSALIGGKFILKKSFTRFALQSVISTNESTRIITGHVIYNLAYTYKFQLKTNKVLEKYQNYHLKIILLNITLLVD